MDKIKKSGFLRRKDNKSFIIMLTSIVIGALLSIGMFVFLGIHMTNRSNNTIDEVGQIYMKGMGKQIAKRYETAITLRLNMVEALVKTNTPDELGSTSQAVINENLKLHASARGFDYLALYDRDGNMELILGKQAQITDPAPFKNSITQGNKKVAVGVGINDEGVEDGGVVFIGVPTSDYSMKDGTKSVALVAGMSNKDIVDMLVVDRDDTTMVYSHIIRKDGSFVIRGEQEEHEFPNYFDQMRSQFNEEPLETEAYIADLSQSMSLNQVYSNIVYTQSGRIHLHCEKLEMSEWYLVTIMDYDTLDVVVKDLSNQWMVMVIVSSLFIPVILFLIFLLYIQFNRQYIHQLQIAREAAIKANKTKSEFLSNMSHDIRTPMNAIVGMTAIARANIDDPEQVQNCLKKIALSSKHLLGLINDVLDMSKIESGKMQLNIEQVSLREILNSIAVIVQPQIKMKKQNFNIYISDISTENVFCDSVRLNQVLLNLLSNAIKFTPDEGSIELSLLQEPSPLGEKYIRNHIIVKDTGIGMKKEFIATIFESFTREDTARVHKTEGTGLGMAITKYIVDAMKGTIEVESELGKGSLFHVVLDLEKAIESEEEMMLPHWNMLVVDDDELLCHTTIAALNSIGVEGDWTLSGETALDKISDAKQKGKKYDIILLDWKLPGIDGVETARRIRQRVENDVPILLISAYDWSDMEKSAREAGISGFISKPLFKSTLYYGLRQFAKDYKKDEPALLQENNSTNLEGIHILLAEDNDLNWEIAEALLKDIGADVKRAENGEICVQMLKNSQPNEFDVILMDIRMPVMTGIEATIEIRKLDHPNRDIPIIAMTADAFSDDIKRCLDCGMNAHVSKPIDIEIVKNTILKFLTKA